MAVVYINPSAASNGSGVSLVDPKNTWSGLTWTAGNEYLQVESTTAIGTIAPSASGTAGARIKIGVCAAQTGEIVHRLGAARLVQSGNQWGIDLGSAGSRNYFDISSLAVVGDPAASGSAIYGRGGTETTVRSNTIRLCSVSHANGIGVDLRGDGWIVEDSSIFSCLNDGLFMQGMNFGIRRNRLTDNDRALNVGDAIQISTAASVGASEILENYIEHPTASVKQGIIAAGASGTLLIARNRIIGGGASAIAPQVPGCIVAANHITECVKGVNVLANNVRVIANLMLDGDAGVVFSTNTTGAVVYANTIASMVLRGIYNLSGVGSASWTARNNLIVSCATGHLVQSTSTATHGNNAYWQCATDTSGGAADGANVTSDPQTTGYRPRPGSLLLTGGADLGHVRDIEGKQGRRFIGAYCAAALRVPV
jgi:hypothetical protein